MRELESESNRRTHRALWPVVSMLANAIRLPSGDTTTFANCFRCSFGGSCNVNWIGPPVGKGGRRGHHSTARIAASTTTAAAHTIVRIEPPGLGAGSGPGDG